MTDALAGHADQVVEELTVATGGNYTFFGGGAGDDGRFAKTYVFCGTRTYSDAVVALEIQSEKPIGVGVAHGWVPTEVGYRVTAVEGERLISLNGAPAVQAFLDHALATGEALDTSSPLPFFLHNILGIRGSGGYRLRVPLAINADGSIACAAAIPLGSVVHIMKTTTQSAVLAARQATQAALETLGSTPPTGCPGVRLRCHAAETGKQLRRRTAGVCRNAGASALRRLQYLRPDRASRRPVRRFPQLHGGGLCLS